MQFDGHCPSIGSMIYGALLSGVTALTFSILAIALKFSLQFADASTIVWFRFIVATIVFSGYFAFKNPKLLRIIWQPKILPLIAALGLTINYWTYLKSISLTSASHAQVLIQLAPLFLAIVGITYFKERFRPLQWTGFFCAILGFGLFFWDQYQLLPVDKSRFLEGNLWIVVSAVGWTVYAVGQKVWGETPQRDTMQFNILVFVACAVIMSPTAKYSQLLEWSPWVWLLMVVLGLNTIIAYTALALALKKIPAGIVSIILASNPLMTLFLMHFLTNTLSVTWLSPELVNGTGYFGAVMVVLGVILTLKK